MLASAQTNVFLNINHNLGAETFANDRITNNNLNDEFKFTRLDYYLSDLTIFHGGGQELTIPDFFLLVHADKHTFVDLGELNISNIEAVKIGVGIPDDYNHTDPSSYDANHALFHQTPSMHWGWAAGYRFVAAEGLAGSKDDVWQLHSLGDTNYSYMNVQTTGIVSTDGLVISLDADYTKLFEDISVDANLNYHGEEEQSPLALSNMHTKVFKEGSTFVGLYEAPIVQALNISPNPSNGHFSVSFNQSSQKTIRVFDVLGQLVFQDNLNDVVNAINLSHLNSGSYSVLVESATKAFFTERIIVL